MINPNTISDFKKPGSRRWYSNFSSISKQVYTFFEINFTHRQRLLSSLLTLSLPALFSRVLCGTSSKKTLLAVNAWPAACRLDAAVSPKEEASENK